MTKIKKSLLLGPYLLASALLIALVPDPAAFAAGKRPLLAQNKAKKDEKAGRKKFLSSEARSKGTKTNIDFDAASIDGERKIPAGVAIGGAKQEHEYDLINLRLRWHPEMIKSTSNLETGKGP